jgi:YYY domain-containing protein
VSPGAEIASVLGWLFVIKLIQVSLWPRLTPAFNRYAYPAAYPASVLLFTLFSWYCGLMAIPIQTALVPFLLLLIDGARTGFYRQCNWKHSLHWDAAMLIPFIILLEIRYLNPSISFAEKFMDHAFLASIIQNPVVPPADPWYAGGGLNVYYYLGHWMMAAIAITSGVQSMIAFNIILPTVLGLTTICLYATGHLLLSHRHWLLVPTVLLVNPAFLIYLASGGALSGVLWNSTRVITNTITEYPLFSFLWGDPHAHVIALFNQAFLIFILLYAWQHWDECTECGRWVITGTAALSLGSMPVINSWDVFVYAPVVLISALAIWRRAAARQSDDPAPWRMLLLVPALAVLIYAPYYLMLETQGIGGIGIVPEPSDPVQFLLVNGFFIAILLFEIAGDVKRQPWLLLAAVPFAAAGYISAALALVPLIYLIARRERRISDTPAAFGLAILCLIEIIYLKDNMGETYYRMNTVFKFSLVAWMLMGVSAFTMIGRRLERLLPPERPDRRMSGTVIVVLVLLLLVLFALPDLSYGHGGGTLDGSAYLENAHPGDAAAIRFLRSLDNPGILVEAEDGDYSYFSRISSFTGIPTIVGMPFHEQMWRGDEGDIPTRMADVRSIYEDPEQTITLMRAYNVTLLYIGDSERERYRVSVPTDALECIYSQNGVEIYRIAD